MTHNAIISEHKDNMFYGFDSKEACAEALGRHVVSLLQQAVSDKGYATLVVSGGSTPVPLFHYLNENSLPWEKITILMADERWVSIDSNDSNEKLIRTHLPKAAGSIFSLAPKHVQETVEQGAERLAASCARLPEILDVVVLGMGDDGHTASLFPHHPALLPALASDAPDCLMVQDSPKPPAERITLSAKRLARSEHIILHITGDNKREVYKNALRGEDVAALPIRYFLLNNTLTPTVYWAS